ncbi:MAG: hypothetical protein RBR93_08730 [Aliarcobacter butzleri]|nr:hypothetical protein [Aliarcobacter butzleri]
MKHNHNLIIKYLEIIQHQEKMINELNKENTRISEINRDLKRHKERYRQDAIFWKEKYGNLKKCIVEKNTQEKYALNSYIENQGY